MRYTAMFGTLAVLSFGVIVAEEAVKPEAPVCLRVEGDVVVVLNHIEVKFVITRLDKVDGVKVSACQKSKKTSDVKKVGEEMVANIEARGPDHARCGISVGVVTLSAGEYELRWDITPAEQVKLSKALGKNNKSPMVSNLAIYLDEVNKPK
jgi:hypothetical protein